MSRMRKELTAAAKTTTTPTDLTAYLLILRAVEGQRGLIHGHLHKAGASCAIGSFFDLHGGKLALPTTLVDEVAAVNDAAPHLSPPARKRHMVEWLRWKLGTLGYAPPLRRARRAPQVDEAAMAQLERQVEDVALNPER